MSDLHWSEGRSVVEMPGSLYLSILSVERESYVRQGLDDDPLAQIQAMFLEPGTVEEVSRIKADATSWEVALIDPQGYGSQVIDGWAQYRNAETSNDSWEIYGNVPIPVVLAWVEEQGGRALAVSEWPER